MKKKFNYKIVDIVENYNLVFGSFFVRDRLKILNFKHKKFKRNFLWMDDFK